MTEFNFARYALATDGAIRNWLACGPVVSPLSNEHMDRVVRPDGSPFGPDGRWIINYWAWHAESARVKKAIYEQLPPLAWQPEGHPQLLGPAVGDHVWRYAAADEDNVIDFSRFNFSPTLMQGWLYAGIESETALTVEAEIVTIGPARLWVNGTLITHDAGHFSYVANQYIPVAFELTPGLNDLYVQGDMLGWREARLALGLRLLSSAPFSVALPLGNIDADRWHAAEAGLDQLVVRQFAFPTLPAPVSLHPAAPQPFAFEARVRIPKPSGALGTVIQALTLPEGVARFALAPGQTGELPLTHDVAGALAHLPGENTQTLTLRPAGDLPLEQHREVWASTQTFRTTPYGDYVSRRREALDHLAGMAAYDVLASMAAVETGAADTISSDAIAVNLHFMNHRYDCADFYSTALLALLYRYGDHPALKADDRQKIEAAFFGFKFWIDEPGIDAMCYFTENHQILFHVTAYLAGQRWPDRVFANSGWTGAQQMDRNRPRIENWILRRLNGNFSEWDSNAYMALDAFAMLALVECASDERLRDMATTLLHKIFFLLACQSFRGAHGSTHGRCYVTGLKSARMENTSNLQRIAWGMGILNGETRATGLLALARRYTVPEVIQRIGADLPDVLTTRARSTASYLAESDMRGDSWDVRTITRRTPDTMLSAAIDLDPGSMGIQEHLWQAMLGPEAVVFTTYPGNSQEHGHARPNFWAGSARLPRVAMQDRTVICLYRLEEGVGLGFTHAYFPTAHFDEWRIDGAWAFARAGSGYVALWADGDLVLTEKGRHAGQELRTRGRGEAWLCTVGSAAEDGEFDAFQAAVTRHTPTADGQHVRWTTPGGETLEFDWTGPLRVNGVAQDWDHFPHYANAYTQTPLGADTIRIDHAGLSLTLDLKHGRTLTED